jgi:hypothetical protein
MAITAGNPTKAFYTFLVIMGASITAHFFNFFLGRFFTTQAKPNNKNLFVFLLTTLWHPYFASVTCFTLGSQQLSSLKFAKVFLPVQLIWNLFWGILMYNVGKLGKPNLGFLLYIFYSYLIIWTLIDLYRWYVKTRSCS